MTNGEAHAAPTAPIVSLSHVSYTYSSHTDVVSPVLQDVSLEIYPGEFVLILGPSGCGKSTLIQLLNGTIPHSLSGHLEGEICSCGFDVRATKVATFSTRVGMVFQDPDAQIINTCVRDEVCFGLENLCYPVTEILPRQRAALAQVGLLDREFASVFELSGGQKQRVSLAAVLPVQPELLVLDEPTANLDPQGMREVFEILEQLNRDHGTTIVMVEHRVDELADKVSRVIVMEEGRIALDGSPREVFSRRLFFSASEPADRDFPEIDHQHSSKGSTWTPQISELALSLSEKCGLAIPVQQFPLGVSEGVALIDRYLQSDVPGRRELNAPTAQPARKPLAGQDDPIATPLIEIRNLDFAYDDGTQILHDVSLRLPAGGIVALLGRNGSGKTTLAKTLLRINEPAKGKVFFKGTDVCRFPIKELTRHIGYVFQNPDHQFVSDRVEDEVAYSLRVRSVPEDIVAEKVDRLLQIVDLERYRHDSPFSLSLGERRRLSVATMLVLEQELLILDEPTIGQDQERAQQLMQMMAHLCREFGTTVLMITHDMRLVAEWAHRAIVMSQGRICFDGTPLALFAQDWVMSEAALLPPPLYSLSHQLHQRYPNQIEPTLSLPGFLDQLGLKPEAIAGAALPQG